MTFKIKKPVLAMIAAEQDRLITAADSTDQTVDELRNLHEQLTEEFEGRSDTWQEGERGEATRQWLDELEAIFTDLEELANTTREQADALGDIQHEPEY